MLPTVGPNHTIVKSMPIMLTGLFWQSKKLMKHMIIYSFKHMIIHSYISNIDIYATPSKILKVKSTWYPFEPMVVS